MKKTFLTAALGCLALSPAIAGQPVSGGTTTDSHNGTLGMSVQDYITLSPNNMFNAGPIAFTTPQEMVNGHTFMAEQMTVVASRAWKFEYSATDFERVTTVSDPLPTGAAQTVAVGNIWKITTNGGSLGVGTNNGVEVPASNILANVANQGSGTLGSSFTLGARLVPGLTNQMSGTYNTTITQIASLN